MSGVRRAEPIAALSLATDLGMGQPLEHELRACLLSMRLGEAAGLADDELRDLFYVAQAVPRVPPNGRRRKRAPRTGR